jgi:hypothetical protein
VHDIDDGDSGVLEFLLGFFGRSIGANINVVVANRDLLAVGLVYNTVNLFEVVRVGDDLVVGEEVLSAVG